MRFELVERGETNILDDGDEGQVHLYPAHSILLATGLMEHRDPSWEAVSRPT